MITNPAPNNVSIFGTSLHIKNPKIIAKIRLKYLIGVTKEASASLQLCVSNKLATLPHKPSTKNNKKSIGVGMIQTVKNTVLNPKAVHKKVK